MKNASGLSNGEFSAWKNSSATAGLLVIDRKIILLLDNKC